MSSQSRPLFAAGLFPSAISTKANDTPIHSRSTDSRDDNDLSSLKLDLHPSTLGAIIAAQKSQSCVPSQQNLEPGHCDRTSTKDVLQPEETSHKRMLSTDSDSEELIQETSPKQRDKSKDKHRKKKKKHKHRKRDHSESLDPVERTQLQQTKIPKHAVFLDDIKGIKPEDAFLIDRKPKKELWHYKSLSKLHIAKYKPLSYNCLGAAHLCMKEKRNEMKSNAKLGLPRYFKKEGLKCIYRNGLFSTVSKSKTLKLPSLDYITFSKEDSQEKADTKTIGNYSCLDDATALYAHGKGAEGYKNEPEVKSENFIMDEIFEKVRRFNQRTQEEPHNVQLWLEFVRFQDVVAQEDKSFKGQVIRLREVYQPSKSVIEKKLAVLDKAIELNPSSLELKMAQLELYQDIWESDKLERAWRDLLFIHSANVDLWQHYLSKQQSCLFKFSFSRVVKCYHQCFKTLVRILDGQVKVLNKQEDMEGKILGLFDQYCSFLHQSGYTERAVSSYQALIEFNHFCPASLNISTSQERLRKFQEFWETSVPKFGEQNAKGWAKWAERINDRVEAVYNSVSTEEQEDAIVLEKLPRSKTWLKMEQTRQDVQWLPWRPDALKGETNESCEDLDRVVLFEDISPAIFRLAKSESCITVVCLFLKFLGLSSEILERKLLEVSGQSSNGDNFAQYSVVSETHLSSLSNLKLGIDVDSVWRPHECLVEFINEILVQAEAYFSLSNRLTFTLLRLELEVLKHGVRRVSEVSKSDTKMVKRFGKSLLKESQNRNNLVVWDTYIRLLWACSDKMDETMSMLDTALTMFTGTFTISDSDNALGLCLLCKTYCQIMLNFEPLEHIKASGRHSAPGVEDKHQAIACLSALVENKKFKSSSKFELSAAYTLKIRKRFQASLNEIYARMEQNLEHSLSDLILALTDCFALFELCASGFKAAAYVYVLAREDVKHIQQTSTREKNPVFRTLLKQLYLSHLSFFVNGMHISFIPLTEIRQVLAEALQTFPECPQLHVLFIETESGSHIAGRMRRFYDKFVRSPVSLISPVFVVMAELTRHYTVIRGQDLADFQLSDSGVVHRVRSVFEQCLQCQVSAHCPLLWRLYTFFEAKYGSKERAKGIFYRALQSCPWAKCIYLDGIVIFGDGELQEVMDLMTEKEIRVRMPLEEVDLLLGADTEDQKDEEDEKLETDIGGDLDVDNNDVDVKPMVDVDLDVDNNDVDVKPMVDVDLDVDNNDVDVKPMVDVDLDVDNNDVDVKPMVDVDLDVDNNDVDVKPMVDVDLDVDNNDVDVKPMVDVDLDVDNNDVDVKPMVDVDLDVDNNDVDVKLMVDADLKDT